MFSSEPAIPSSIVNNSAYKNVVLQQNEFLKSKEMMGSNLYAEQQSQQSSGLLRYRSAPSSFFAGILDNAGENFMVNNEGSSSSDSENMFSTMLSSDSRDLKSFMKPEIAESENQNQNQMVYEACEMRSYGLEMEIQAQIRHQQNFRNSSNLIRQSSSPAGFFSGFDIMREAGNYKASNGSNGESGHGLSSNGFNNHINYSSAQCSSSNFMPSIAENESWNDSSYNCLKRTRDGDFKMLSDLNGLDSQNGEPRNCTPTLTHHLSLPSSSVEIDKYLHFQQETVPCKIRAKRGCATHPRSIAERNRRSRISERMKKLQDLFPKMDKQTSTADMLDWAVDHIKELQKQVQTLTEKKAKCTCSSKAQQYSNGES